MLRDELILRDFKNTLEVLKISNTSLTEFGSDFPFLKYFDVSKNRIKRFDRHLPISTLYLNLSYNNLEYILSDDLDFKIFMDKFVLLNSIDLSKSFSKSSISNKELFFNKYLEYGYFSGNKMNLFPKFCQVCLKCREDVCKLKELKFDSNNLEKNFYSDLLEMKNLEYLDLENNSITIIELHSFSDLINLETLILFLNN